MGLITLTPLKSASAPPPFSPTDIANLSLWLDASDTATINGGTITGGGTVTTWADKSGNSNTATPGGSAVTWNATGINSKGTMTMGGSSWFALANTLSGAGFSLYFVTQLTATLNQGFFGRNVGSGAAGGFVIFGATPTMSVFDNTVNESDWDLSISTATPYIFSTITNNVSANSTGYLNGVLQTQTAHIGTTYSLTIGVVGARDMVLYNLNGLIAEAIIYSANLSGSDDTKVINYLKSKWNI